MASFIKYSTKKGDRWYYVITLGIDPATGKRVQKKVRGFLKKKDAQIAASKVEQELSTGSYINEQNITFKDFIPEWLAMYEKNGAKISSVRGRQKQLDRLADYFAHVKMKDITPLMYQNVLSALHEKDYAYNTIDGIHSAGRMIFKKALELHIIGTNPTTYARLRKNITTVEELESSSLKIKFLEKEELSHLLDSAKRNGKGDDYLILVLLAYSGLRSGELIALKWSDVDFSENTFSITKTIYNPNNNRDYKLLTPKTKGSIRKIKMDTDVMCLLEQHRSRQLECKELMGKQFEDLDFVLTRPDGYPIYHNTIQDKMKRHLKLSNISTHFTPHSLRHTHTSLLIEADVGIKEIQQRLGHTDINTTMNIYAHMTKNMEEKASQKFSKLMKGFVV